MANRYSRRVQRWLASANADCYNVNRIFSTKGLRTASSNVVHSRQSELKKGRKMSRAVHLLGFFKA
jgi:hypothetical protein